MTLCRDTEGKLLYHVHVVFEDETGKINGGYLIDRGNVVLATWKSC
jgi:predicted DNA-binding protein with PD1-like motif